MSLAFEWSSIPDDRLPIHPNSSGIMERKEVEWLTRGIASSGRVRLLGVDVIFFGFGPFN
jgi:hypothetical protein